MGEPLLPVQTKVAALRDPAAYPEATAAVSVIETHMSWVFLTEQHAYKLKKPVRYEYLDFSTLAARRRFCEEELRLNRRLAESVYLGVLPLATDATGRLIIDGDGEVVDWLVRMRRLPADRMLDRALLDGTATAADAERSAARIAAFHHALPPAPVTAHAYRRRLAAGILENERALCDPAFGLPDGDVRAICHAQHDMLEWGAGHFDRRVHEGRIVEGHGDLRPEHVCLEPGIPVIDCLEFSAMLRTLDTIDEIAFLALECERLGRADFADALLSAYVHDRHERGCEPLVHFYQSYRALVRAKMAAWHLRERAYRQSPKWTIMARHYLRLAGHHIERCRDGWRAGHQVSSSAAIDSPE
ncbi:hypothetical protein WKR88_00355 [Trinickia caryophylli]|uniref:Aminoglycoside phosphotransferase family enzyme n=1 Tax=Trinickia caryophylli TaxID=28094 RepID=A0A1X7D1D4_TRICW|nr:hypothetical protein [Trinickia caryophylli]PMS13566.1 hypothetical protein C0Z17_04610 [Trinickia caryophylli]TRX15266.1 hypothetical protein FNF07_29250 [Trinickia caryophylli]WQE15142.1 hypothetical protein U0034_21575 [Trinickia caryophylli]SMF06705.1 Aminoglycoside phosphotransferase family enzyme [Trinickia caryophylli]GLU31121.1 hypothetical protein Busp01_09630 [Trinickia caryophylli]